MRKNSEWLCMDCHVNTSKAKEYFMLVDPVWNLVHSSAHGILCVGCVEKRLGRRLVPADFSNCYLNWGGGFEKSMRLADRQGLL